MADIQKAVLSGRRDLLVAAISELIADAFESGELDLDQVYTKAEVDQMISDLQDQIDDLDAEGQD